MCGISQMHIPFITVFTHWICDCILRIQIYKKGDFYNNFTIELHCRATDCWKQWLLDKSLKKSWLAVIHQNKLFLFFPWLHVALITAFTMPLRRESGLLIWWLKWKTCLWVLSSRTDMLKHKSHGELFRQHKNICQVQTGANNHKYKICLLLPLFHRNRVNFSEH